MRRIARKPETMRAAGSRGPGGAASASRLRARYRSRAGVPRLIRFYPDFDGGFFLFYLTGNTISDNRHGLLTKFDGGRRTETLSSANPQNY